MRTEVGHEGIRWRKINAIDSHLSPTPFLFNVADIDFFGRKIYPNADIVEIKNAMHDIVLSADEVIEDYFMNISKWLKEHY